MKKVEKTKLSKFGEIIMKVDVKRFNNLLQDYKLMNSVV